MTRPTRWKIVAVAFGVSLVAVACGSSGSPSGGGSASGGGASAAASSPAPGPNPALCQNKAALRASLDKLTHHSVGSGENTAHEIKHDLADVKERLTKLTADAHGQWQPQISALKAALDKLQTAAADLASNPGASTVSAVVTALGGVTTAGSSLLAAMDTDCPSASASPVT
jgi:hypothetical protein